jgi:hypothetical protein
MRTVGAISGAVAFSLVATACGGSPRTNGAQLDTHGSSHGALAFSSCIRSHSVPRFPDPDSSGAIPKVSLQQLEVSGSQFEAAQSACASLLGPSKTQVSQTVNGMLAFSHCMRSHGVVNWPDPSTDRDGQAVFDLRGQINPNTARMDAMSGRCAYLLRPVPGQNGTVLCNGVREAGCHHYG